MRAVRAHGGDAAEKFGVLHRTERTPKLIAAVAIVFIAGRKEKREKIDEGTARRRMPVAGTGRPSTVFCSVNARRSFPGGHGTMLFSIQHSAFARHQKKCSRTL